MKKSNKIVIFLGLGSVIALGYYFLKNSKPTLDTEQLAKLNTDTTSLIEAELKPKPTIEEQLLIDKCLPFKTRGEIERCKRGELTFVPTTSTTTTTPTSTTGTTPTRSNTTTTTTTTPTPTTTTTPTPNVGTTPTRVNTTTPVRGVYSGGRR
jgi:hypothetical protein